MLIFDRNANIFDILFMGILNTSDADGFTSISVLTERAAENASYSSVTTLLSFMTFGMPLNYICLHRH